MVSVLMLTGALGLFLWEISLGTSLETARTIAVNALVVCEMFYLLNSRYILAPVTNRAGFLGNRYVLLAIGVCILLQLAFTHAPVMQIVFGSTDLTLQDWLKVAAAGLLVFCIAEGEKLVLRSTGLAARFVPG
jgi:magnesium-transporting ATPase (P-type)